MHRFLLSIGLFFIASIAVAAPLSDVSGNKNQAAIEFLQKNGIIGGYADGTFKPENVINRAELLKILVKSVGITPSVTDYHDCFSDVHKEWYAPYVCAAKRLGWISGYDDGSFKPAQIVNTAEAIKMLVNVYGYQPMQTSSVAPFRDVNLSAWYAPYVLVARNAGILDVGKGSLGIASSMTRGRMSGMIYRAVIVRGATGGHAAAQTQSAISIFNTFRRGGGGGGGNNPSSNQRTSSQISLSSPTITFGNLTKIMAMPISRSHQHPTALALFPMKAATQTWQPLPEARSPLLPLEPPLSP